GLPFRTEGDTIPANAANFDIRVANRLNSASGGKGFDAVTNLYIPLKYRVRSSGAILADGVEARLIEAEAQNAAGNYATALTTLNTLRSQTATIIAARAA